MDPIRPVNVRVLGILLASLGVSALAVFSAHAYQVKRNRGVFRRQAEQAAGAGHVDQAVRYYFRYLGYAPEDTEARIKCAAVFEKKPSKSSRDYQAILDLYEAVLRADPANDDIRRRLVHVAMRLQRYADAQAHLMLLLEGHANDGELEQLYARCAVVRNDNLTAERYYLQAITHAAHDPASYVLLAEVYDRINEKDKADKIMAKLVKANPRDYQAHLAYSRHLYGRGQMDAMGKEIEQAFALAEDKLETIQAMADWALQQRQPDLARKYFKEAVERFPAESSIYLASAQMELDAGKVDAAVASLRRGLQEVPPKSRNPLRYLLARCLISRGDKDEVDSILKTMEQSHAAQVEVNELRARALLAGGQWTEAAALLEKTQHQLTSTAAAGAGLNVLLGTCYEKRGEPDRALNAFKQALTADPKSTEARVGVADALQTLGRADEALAEYRAVLPRVPQVRTRVALLLIRRNLRVEKAKRNWDEVEKLLEDASRATPGSTEVIVARLHALLAQERNGDAQALIKKSCKDQPTKLELWLAWANLADAMNAGRNALDILTEAESKLGDRVDLRLARAWHWRQDAGKSGTVAADIRKLEENLEHFSNDEKATLLHGLGDVYAQLGNFREAKRLWAEVAALQPQDLQIRLTLFDLALQEKDDNAIDKLMEEIKALDSEGTQWRLSRANGLIRTARRGDPRLAEAKSLLAEVAARRRLWGAPLRSLAAIDDLEGNPQLALEKYEQALQLGDRNPEAMRRAIHLLWSQQRFTEANQLVEKLDDQGILTQEGRRTRAFLYIQEADYESAIALARQVLAQGSHELPDVVFLGQVLGLAGEKHHREAEETLRRALQMPEAAKSGEPWVVLVRFLAAARQKDRARAIIEEGRRKLSPDLVTLTLAQCFEALQDFESAALEFDNALKKKPGDLVTLRGVASFHLRRGQLRRAEPYLWQIADPQTQAPPADVAWARRNLALVAAGFDLRRIQEARKLLEENTRSKPGSIDDQRSLAVLLAAHPQTRREALRILENLPGGQTPTLEQRLVLAMLYELTRQWTRAREAYNTLASSALAVPEPKLDYVAYCARTLLRHGETDDARAWLDKLEEKDPDSSQTLDIRVRVLKAQNQTPAAEALLAAYLQKSDADLELAARLFEEIGRIAQAEQIYRKLSKQEAGPRRTIDVARFLARHGSTDDALQVCDRLARMGERDLAAELAMLALRSGRTPGSAQCQHAERLLNDAIQRGSQPVAARLHLAALRELQQNFKEAEAIYRQILDQDAVNVFALNNLAWLLGLQAENTAEALQLINRALEQSGRLPDLLDTRALVYLKSGQAKNALADLDAALADADLPTLYFHRAQALFPASQKAARESLQKAQELKLSRTDLHPLERQAYDELVAMLGLK